MGGGVRATVFDTTSVASVASVGPVAPVSSSKNADLASIYNTLMPARSARLDFVDFWAQFLTAP